MNLMIKPLHSNFKPPRYATIGSGAFDMQAMHGGTCNPGDIAKIALGCAVAVPEGFVLLISARSGHGFKYGAGVPQGYGVIDSDYRGEIFMLLQTSRPFTWEAGDRICQALVVKAEHVRFDLVTELPNSARGEGGFGSTGDK